MSTSQHCATNSAPALPIAARSPERVPQGTVADDEARDVLQLRRGGDKVGEALLLDQAPDADHPPADRIGAAAPETRWVDAHDLLVDPRRRLRSGDLANVM